MHNKLGFSLNPIVLRYHLELNTIATTTSTMMKWMRPSVGKPRRTQTTGVWWHTRAVLLPLARNKAVVVVVAADDDGGARAEHDKGG